MYSTCSPLAYCTNEQSTHTRVHTHSGLCSNANKDTVSTIKMKIVENISEISLFVSFLHTYTHTQSKTRKRSDNICTFFSGNEMHERSGFLFQSKFSQINAIIAVYKHN